ncbi:MAG TPA: aldehyde dehydrogenase [Streptosporangiaceae bacterium]|nr:aldehyde dehydrogenase [Streptosporangiaceae bacterium]
MRDHDRFYIGGQWVAPAGSATIEVISPHTEEVVGRVPEGTTADMDRAVEAARDAFDNGPWPRMDPADRAAAVGKLADLYAARLGDFAEIITQEMGSPITFSQLAQAPQPQMMLSYFADLGKTFTWEDERPGMFGPVTVRREPVGVVAAIVPWNVPQFTIMTKLPAALVAGCSVVIKPAPETPLDAYLLAELIEQAEMPPGVVNIVPAGREVGEHLVSHAGVDKVAFTGSTAAGRRIGSICGQQLKRCSLELGGKSAAIICDDADLAATMGWLQMASLMNNGQACVAQTRILAPRSRYDETVDALTGMVAGLSVGDPADPATQIGPLVAKRQQDRVEGYISIGQEEGAKVVAGGSRASGRERGWYVAPTVFADVDPGMRIAREEIFGPVLAVIPYEDTEHAIKIANDSDYGLAGTVWTSDAERGMQIARRVRTGTYGVNMYMIEACAPFGGYKASGIGRELGPEGLMSYLEYKSIASPAA